MQSTHYQLHASILVGLDRSDSLQVLFASEILTGCINEEQLFCMAFDNTRELALTGTEFLRDYGTEVRTSCTTPASR